VPADLFHFLFMKCNARTLPNMKVQRIKKVELSHSSNRYSRPLRQGSCILYTRTWLRVHLPKLSPPRVNYPHIKEALHTKTYQTHKYTPRTPGESSQVNDGLLGHWNLHKHRGSLHCYEHHPRYFYTRQGIILLRTRPLKSFSTTTKGAQENYKA